MLALPKWASDIEEKQHAMMLKVAVVRKANKTRDDKRSELHSPKAFDAVLADLLANLNAADEEY